MTGCEIENGIPLPEAKHGRYPRNIYHELEVGQSVFIPEDNPLFSIRSIYQIKGKKFARRKVEKNGVNGLRIWRLE